MTQPILISGKYGIYVKDPDKFSESLYSLQLLLLLDKLFPACLEKRHYLVLAFIRNDGSMVRKLLQTAKKCRRDVMIYNLGEGCKMVVSDTTVIFKKAEIASDRTSAEEAVTVLKQAFFRSKEKDR